MIVDSRILSRERDRLACTGKSLWADQHSKLWYDFQGYRVSMPPATNLRLHPGTESVLRW